MSEFKKECCKMRKYLKLKENNTKYNFLEIDFYYHLGGLNYFTYKNEARGYYISVTPVIKNGITITLTAFTGIKQLVKEVTRKSKKAESEALKIAESIENELIDYILGKYGLELED